MDESISLGLQKRSEPLVWTETLLLSVINVLAFSGNISVCYAVYRNQRLCSLPNMFVVALAVSDISVSICCMPFPVSALYHSRWILGTKFCRVQGFACFTFGMASLSTMTLIAVSRYFCITKQEKYILLFSNEGFLCTLLVCVAWPLLGLCLHFFSQEVDID